MITEVYEKYNYLMCPHTAIGYGGIKDYLKPGDSLGTAKARDRKEELLSQIISRLNELFITDQLTDKDLVNYAYTIRDKVKEKSIPC